MILKAKLNKRQVVETYTQKAPIYDTWGKLTETKARNRSLELANIQDGETILEVAVGTGLTFIEILKANPNGQNHGVDLTAAMVEKAKEKAAISGTSNYQLGVGDAYNLDFPDDHFDLLVNNYMFDLLPQEDFPRVLAEFHRVIKPDGRIILINMTKGERFYQKIWDAVYRISPPTMGGCRGVLLEPIVREMGFTNVHREMLSEMTFPSEIIRATL